MKARLAALALPLLLLIPGAAPVAAQTPEDCTLSVSIFDEKASDACSTSLGGAVDQTPAAALKAAQARWDAIAAIVGKPVATLWLGARPKTVADLWFPIP